MRSIQRRDCIYLVLWNGGFKWPSFVKNSVQIIAQQRIKNTAKISTSSPMLQRLISRLRRISSSNLNKMLRELITNVCVRNTTFFIFKSTVYWNIGLKVVMMPDTSYEDQQKAQYGLWMGEGLGGTDSRRKFFRKCRMPTPSSCAIILWYQSCSYRGGHFETGWESGGGEWGPKSGEEKQKQIKEICQDDPTRSLRVVGAAVVMHYTNVWHF